MTAREKAIEAAAEAVRLEDLRRTEFEAIQFTGTVESLEAIKAWAGSAVSSWSGMPKKNVIDRLHIRGVTFSTRPGDWVIRETRGDREKFTSVEAQFFPRYFRVVESESALLDRVEEAVKGLRAGEAERSFMWARSYSVACDDFLAVLTEIREEE